MKGQRMPTVGMLAAIQEKRSTLRRRFVTWREVQERYMPFIPYHEKDAPIEGLAESEESEDTEVPIEKMPLYLPSQLPKDVIRRCPARLVSMETRMRHAQCEDGLVELRCLLRI